MCKTLTFGLISASCAFLLALALSGCGKSGPPPPLALDQVPAALNQAFSQGRPELKELSDRAVSSLQNRELGKALAVVEGLSATPDLTKEQRETATRALLTLNQELQAAQARGDKQAAEWLRARRQSR